MPVNLGVEWLLSDFDQPFTKSLRLVLNGRIQPINITD